VCMEINSTHAGGPYRRLGPLRWWLNGSIRFTMSLCALGDLFRVLTSPERRAVLVYLALGSSSVCTMAPRLGLSIDQASEHLAELTRCGLVSVLAGEPVLYGLAPDIAVSKEKDRVRITIRAQDGQEMSFAESFTFALDDLKGGSDHL
jgi:DNA-binding transcriptional ArsR family regulator